MFTFMTLLLTLITITVLTAVILAAGGTVFLVVFGDLIVCIFIITMISKLFRRKK